MNHSLVTADRNTHLKIVVIALVAGIAVIGIGLSARLTDPSIASARYDASQPVLKAGKPMVITHSGTTTIR